MTNVTNHDEDVDLGKEVTARRERPSGPVVAVRIPREVLARLSAYAEDRGTTISDVVRQAAINFVSGVDTSRQYFVSSGAALAGGQIEQDKPAQRPEIKPSIKTYFTSDTKVSQPAS